MQKSSQLNDLKSFVEDFSYRTRWGSENIKHLELRQFDKKQKTIEFSSKF